MEYKKIAVEMSNQCNLRCELCGRNDFVIRKTHHLKPQAIENFELDKFPNIQISMVGRIGDPIMSPYIKEACSIIKKSGNFTAVGSNGTIRNEDWWYTFPKYLPKRHCVIFALDGTTPDVYSYYRRNGNYDKAINNMKAFIKGGGRAIWQFILFKHNQHQLKDVARLSEKYGCEYVIMPSNVYDKKYEEPTIYDNIKSNSDVMTKERFPCRLEYGEVFLASSGLYQPCCGIIDFTTSLRLSKAKVYSAYDYTLTDIIELGYYDAVMKNRKNIAFCNVCNVVCGQRLTKDINDIQDKLL